jgi:AcrR family transcriptional regulator
MMKEGASVRVRRKHAERRERIVEAAFASIAESGPVDFSLNQLARDLDYTPGALYWYFPSKEALVVEVQRVAFTELAVKFQVAREGWEGAPALREIDVAARRLHSLLALARFYLELGKSEPAYARLIAFSLDPRLWLDDELAKQLTPVLATVFAEVATPFFAAQRDAVLSDGNGAVRAVQYWSALQGALQVGKLERIAPDLIQTQRLAMDTAETLLRGWGADVEALAVARAHLT